MANKPKLVKDDTVLEEPIACTCCGTTYKKQDKNFYKSTYSKAWKCNNNYCPICKSCLDKMFKEYKQRYESDKTALVILCHYIDIPFYNSLFQSIIEKNNIFSVGLYLRQINGRQYQYKTFLNTLVDGELSKSSDEVKDERETRWSKQDQQNKNYVLSITGYDPFEDMEMTDADRKFCYNLLSGYCDTDGIKEDGHKRQSCIQITINQLQCKKIDEMINQQLTSSVPNEMLLSKLTTSKKQMLDAINALAKENNIASAHNGTAKAGKNTLSQKMKDMDSDGIEDIKVNLFDVETCEWMKQVADLSNQSILEQLNFDSNETTTIIKEQREMILSFQDELAVLKEENRIMNNQLIDLKLQQEVGG